MSFLDTLLGHVREHVDVENLASKIGLSGSQVESAILALAKSHTADGDTVQLASGETGLPTDKLSQIVEHIGGEGALARFAQILNADEASGGLMGSVGKLFGKD